MSVGNVLQKLTVKFHQRELESGKKKSESFLDLCQKAFNSSFSEALWSPFQRGLRGQCIHTLFPDTFALLMSE